MPIEDSQVERSCKLINTLVDNIETVIVGKREPVLLTVLSLVAGGHVLLEDLPGLGKTSLVKALAKSIDCSFSRIQFTPDIMPSDVVGFSVYNQKTQDFEYRPGAVMANIVLVDEVNRASAKTQSALLEVMEERQVTVDSATYTLAEPFMVLATQNPVESFGTYPLPEAQVDRFLIKLSMGYPGVENEKRIMLLGKAAKSNIRAVLTGDDIIWLRQAAEQVTVSDPVALYIVEIVEATRHHADIKVGASPRGSIALMSLCCAYALSQGRGFVTPADVKHLVPFVLGHRIILSHDAKADQKNAKDVLSTVVSSIAVPMGF